MDVGEDDFGLIHSKFRKAQRKVVSRLTTDSSSPSSILPPPPPVSLSSSADKDYSQDSSSFASTHSIAHHHLHPTTITRSVSFSEEHMHVESVLSQAPPSFTSTPSRLDTVITSSAPPRTSVLPKSPIFGTNNSICFGAGALSHHPSHSYVSSPVEPQPTSGRMPCGGGATNPSSAPSSSFPCEVFRFDSTDRERYLCSAISEEEEVFGPGPSPSFSLSSNYDSPQIILDSPRITISPLRIQDSPPYSRTPTAPLTPSPKMDSQNKLMARVGGHHPSLAMLPPSASISLEQSRCLFGVPSSPVSPLTPNTPLSPSPLFNVDQQTFQQGFLAELYRRR